MEFNNDYITLALTLELLSVSLNYQEAYISKFPENEEHALSYSVDPNCSCRVKLIEHFKKNKESVDQLNQNFLEKYPSEINLGEFLTRVEINNVAGKFFKIEKTEEAYSVFVENMKNERWAFKHMSVTSEDDSYVIFFA
tara:strand:- start:688 stop:1104 length:417 start_codon:yes stop_codon:yes gene_type:complete